MTLVCPDCRYTVISAGETALFQAIIPADDYSAVVADAGFSIPSSVARSSIRLILKSKSGWVENNWFSLLVPCAPLSSCSFFSFWKDRAIDQGFLPAFFKNS